jgi:hypothetical protein
MGPVGLYAPMFVRFGSKSTDFPCPRHVGSSSNFCLGVAPQNPSFRANRDIPLVYSITSSARASRVGGKVRPSALAVLRLIRSSNLVA